jgi:hypothetical protein
MFTMEVRRADGDPGSRPPPAGAAQDCGNPAESGSAHRH